MFSGWQRTGSLVRGERELVLHSSGQDDSSVNYLPLVAGDDSLWRLRCIQDTQSPWWSFPPQWAGWLPTGREGTTTAWRSFPGSQRARLRRPGSHNPPAAGRHRGFSLKTHFNTIWRQNHCGQKKAAFSEILFHLFPSNPHQRSNFSHEKKPVSSFSKWLLLLFEELEKMDSRVSI